MRDVLCMIALAGQRDSRLDGPAGRRDYSHDASGEHDGEEDEDDESSEDAAYLEAVDLGQEENWPATRWRDDPAPPPRAPQAAAPQYGLSAAASSRQRSSTLREPPLSQYLILTIL